MPYVGASLEDMVTSVRYIGALDELEVEDDHVHGVVVRCSRSIVAVQPCVVAWRMGSPSRLTCTRLSVSPIQFSSHRLQCCKAYQG